MKANIKASHKTLQMGGMSKKEADRIVNQYTYNFVEQRLEAADLFIEWGLHEVFGFGKVRLKRLFDRVTELMDEYIKKYGDVECATIAIKNDLNSIGYNYDEEIARSTERAKKLKVDVWKNKELDR